jgi:hypothetical protein
MSLVQVHLKERMHALEEKNNLSTELHQTRKKLEELANQKVRIRSIYSLKISVADPDPNPDPSDPYVSGPSGSGSISQRYGSEFASSRSGSFYLQAKKVRKTLIHTVL